MPAFRGTLSIEETWAMARYLRTFGAIPRSDAIAVPKASSADKDKQ